MSTQEIQKTIALSCEAGIATISLSRPPVNAYNAAMLEELLEILKSIESSSDIRVVVLESAIEGYFSAGADVNEFASNTRAENLAVVEMARAVTLAISNSSKPYIGAIAGHALGGGLELALACDMRIGLDGTQRIGLPEVKLGLMPGNGGVQRLTRVVGPSRAVELCMMGGSITPKQAETWGLFNQLLSSVEFQKGVYVIATTLAASAPLALTAVKRCVAHGAAQEISTALQTESLFGDALYETDDAREGLTAFAERRIPRFAGS